MQRKNHTLFHVIPYLSYVGGYKFGTYSSGRKSPLENRVEHASDGAPEYLVEERCSHVSNSSVLSVYMFALNLAVVVDRREQIERRESE